MDMMGNVWCKMCNRNFPLDVMEVDHIKPKSKGGSDKPRNLRLLCPTCNRRKGAKEPSETKQESEFGFGFDPSDII